MQSSSCLLWPCPACILTVLWLSLTIPCWTWLCLACVLPSLSMSCPCSARTGPPAPGFAPAPAVPCPAQPVPERAGGSRGGPGVPLPTGPDRGGGRGRTGRGAERLRSAGAGGVSQAAAGGGGSRSSETAAAPALAPAPGTVRRAQVRAAVPPQRSHRRDLGSRRAPAARLRLRSPGAGGGAARRPAISRCRRGRATAGLGDRCPMSGLPELRDESRARARAPAQAGPGMRAVRVAPGLLPPLTLARRKTRSSGRTAWGVLVPR